MYLVLRKDPDWPKTLFSTDISAGALTLLGEDGSQVQVPAGLLVAVSPLVKNMMADLLPPAYSPHVISLPAVTGAVLLVVAELLSKGATVVHANNGEVQDVFKMMGIEASFSYCVVDTEVKDEGFAEDCSESYVKIEDSDENKKSEYYEDFESLSAIKVKNKRNESNLSKRNDSHFEDPLPSNENKPEDDKKVQECDKNVNKNNVRQHGVKPFKCDHCAYKAISSAYLKRHMLNHGVSRFACDECAYRCVTRSRLRQHMLVHSREKTFACDLCDYRTVTRGRLNEHMVTHTGEKPFACDQCEYRAVRRARLNEHMVTHTGEKAFACDQCDFRAVSRGRLNEHMVIHTEEKAFACDQCDYRAVSRRRLNEHLVIHKVDKPFACDQCDYRTVRRASLKKHMLKH